MPSRPLRGFARYVGLLRVQVRASTLLSLQYRADFFIDTIIEVFWAMSAVVPLFVVFGARSAIAGWSFGAALLVTGWFTLLQAVVEGAINPSVTSVVDHIRKGTLDFVLLKPADAQFLVSTARFLPLRAVNALTAAVLFGYGFHLLGRRPSVGEVALALGIFAVAMTVLYSLWIVTVSAAFYVVKIDNLTYFFNSIVDAARWPSSVFRGVVRVLFTFVIPLALMTTYPAEALLGTLGRASLAGAVLGGAAFALLARWVWLRALARYTSASS